MTNNDNKGQIGKSNPSNSNLNIPNNINQNIASSIITPIINKK